MITGYLFSPNTDNLLVEIFHLNLKGCANVYPRKGHSQTRADGRAENRLLFSFFSIKHTLRQTLLIAK